MSRVACHDIPDGLPLRTALIVGFSIWQRLALCHPNPDKGSDAVPSAMRVRMSPGHRALSRDTYPGTPQFADTSKLMNGLNPGSWTP